MVRNVAKELLELIKNNNGIEPQNAFIKPNSDILKITDIILSECRFSITDANRKLFSLWKQYRY